MAVLQLLQRMKMRQFYPIVLLVVSNIFMTFAWYGHLKYKSAALWTVILASWGIAFFEYCFQVPANRIGHDYFTAPQLKIMQEIHYPCGFCSLFGALPQRRAEMERRGRFSAPSAGSFFRLQKMGLNRGICGQTFSPKTDKKT